MSVDALRDALRDALERRGILNNLRASIRSSVFSAMEDQEDAQPPMPGENIVINELIREYLAFNNYNHTLAVFAPEVGLPSEPLRRPYIAQQTSLPERVGSGDPDLPLIYGLLAPPQPQRLSATTEQPRNVIQSPTAKGAMPPPQVPLVPTSGNVAHNGGASLVSELPMAEISSATRRSQPTPVVFTAGSA